MLDGIPQSGASLKYSIISMWARVTRALSRRDAQGRIKPGIEVAFLLLLFGGVRVAAHHRGVRFDTTPLEWYWQYIDPILLKERLLESVFYLHTQPPLFNLFLGSSLKLFPESNAFFFQTVYLILGLALVGAIHFGQIRLGVPTPLATVMTFLWLINPAALLIENWLFYTLPVASFLILAAFPLSSYLRTGRRRSVFVFFLILGAVALTRSLFHLAWMAGMAGLLLVLRPRNWRRTLLAASAPLLLVLAVYAKNTALFGTFSTSSWMNSSFSKIAYSWTLPEEDRFRLVDEGVLTEHVHLMPFAELRHIRITDPSFKMVSPPTGIPVLDNEHKADSDFPNYNHIDYLRMSRIAGRNNYAALRHRPGAFLRGVEWAWGKCFQASTTTTSVSENQSCIDSWERSYARFVLGRPSHDRDDLMSICFALFAAYLIAIFYGLWTISAALIRSGRALLKKRNRENADPPLPPERLEYIGLIAYLWINVMWILCLGNLLELGENNRFRFTADPMAILLFSAALTALGGKLGRYLRRWRNPPT